MQNGPEHNKIFDWGCILAQNAVKYSLTYTKKLSVKPAAHGQARLHTTSQALRASSPDRGAKFMLLLSCLSYQERWHRVSDDGEVL